MLILTRKENEALTLTTAEGETIEITLLDAKFGEAKIGVDAAQSVRIERNEIMND